MANKEETKVRTICVDADAIEVAFRYDGQWNVWLGDYPYFKEEPRHTPSGRPWRNAVYAECPHHPDPEYNDCGSCAYFKKEDPKDMIGVCFCDALRMDPAKVSENLTHREVMK